MRNTQPIPTCPRCKVRVYRTHTCRSSGLTPGSLDAPARVGAPLALVPMPDGWRDQARALMLAPEPTWPNVAQLHLVEEDDLDWSDPA